MKQISSIATLVACVGGCLPELETIQGRRLLYEHSVTAHPCGGTVAFLDRFIVTLEDQLGVSAPEHLRYSWLIDGSADPPPAFTPPEVDWAVGGRVVSSSPALPHEVVHLVAGHSAPPFFREGLAVAYDALQPLGYGTRYWDEIDFDPRRTMAATSYQDIEYGEAGMFVSFLLTRHGPAKFRAFYTRIAPPHTMPLIRAAFRSVYGVELDSEAELFMAGPPPCEAHYFSLQLFDCSAPLRDWQNGEWTVTEPLECDSPEVVGGIRPSGGESSFRSFTLEIKKPGSYVLETTGDEHVWIRLGPCFGCVWDDPDDALAQGETRELELAAGTYYLRVAGDPERSPSVGVVLRPA